LVYNVQMTSNHLQLERTAIIEQLNCLSQVNADIGHRQIVFISANADSAFDFIGEYIDYLKVVKAIINVLPLDKHPVHPTMTAVVTPKHSVLDNKLSKIDQAKSRYHFKICRPDKPNTLLGFDCQNAIIDCSLGFYPDALTALAGTINPGGFLFVICPPLTQWPNSTDDFACKRTPLGFLQPTTSANIINRFIQTCLKYQAISISILNGQITLNDSQEKPITTFKANALDIWYKPEDTNHQLNKQQDHVFKMIYHSLPINNVTKNQTNTEQNDKPLFHIIQADRGRGKSHVLGHLINSLIPTNLNLENNFNIDNGINYYITAPNKAAIQSVAKIVKYNFHEISPFIGDKFHESIHFIAPEKVLNKVKSTDILLIDEAASLPLPQLMSWANYFKIMIFATTTHGYEGTGKGFQIRFINYLHTLSNNTHQHHLTAPIRYAENDPLEQAMFKSFALNSEPQGLACNFDSEQIEQAQSRLISQQELADNPDLLDELFSLLVQAHYQTRPSDIRDLLDAPGIVAYGTFITASNHQYLTSACLLSFEGNLNAMYNEIIDNINKGVRRPQGHLIPQVLTLHMNQKNALSLLGARIIRIATLANVQNQNLGSKLIKFVHADLSQKNIDYLGSSYADTKDVNSFWNKNGFTTVRSGKKLDKASGTFSTVVIKGLSNKGKLLEQDCQQFFRNQQQLHSSIKSLSVSEKDIIQIFIEFTGSYEAIKDILSRCADWATFYQGKPFPKKASQVFRDYVKNWSEL
jgi:tRNA(Met) cytidine acetyltransferase